MANKKPHPLRVHEIISLFYKYNPELSVSVYGSKESKRIDLRPFIKKIEEKRKEIEKINA